MRIPMLHARAAAEGRTQEDQKRAFVFSIPRCRRDSIWNEGDIILAYQTGGWKHYWENVDYANLCLI